MIVDCVISRLHWNLKFLVFVEHGKAEILEKALQARQKPRKTQPTYD